MDHIENCRSIDDVRTRIDQIDRQIVTLLAARGAYVKQAARFKKTTDDVKAPQRVEQVIAKVTALAAEWERLDRFEGDGYQRVIAQAMLEDGQIVAAYVYQLKRQARFR